MIGFKEHPPASRDEIIRNVAFHEAAHIIVGLRDGLRVVNINFNAFVADRDPMFHANVAFNGCTSLTGQFAGVAAYCYQSGDRPTASNIRHLIAYSGSRKDLADALAHSPELFHLDDCVAHTQRALDVLYEHEADFVRLAVTIEGAMQTTDSSIRDALAACEKVTDASPVIECYAERITSETQRDALHNRWSAIVASRPQRPWHRLTRWIDRLLDRALMTWTLAVNADERARISTREPMSRIVAMAKEPAE